MAFKAFLIKLKSLSSAMEVVLVLYKKPSVQDIINKLVAISGREGLLHFMRKGMVDGQYVKLSIEGDGLEIASDLIGLPTRDSYAASTVFNHLTEVTTLVREDFIKYLDRKK